MFPVVLNLFYEEPEGDRWIPFDRYPRRIIRRLVRGKPRIGGQRRVFLNLCVGLDRIGIKYRVNDYRHVNAHPDEVACILGKPFVLDKTPWHNPILLGPCIYSHPLNDSELLQRLPIRKIIVPGEWMRKMCELYWGELVSAWPVGIDTEKWKPASKSSELGAASMGKLTDFLIYDKLYWNRESQVSALLEPIRQTLASRGLSFTEIRYGYYQEPEFELALQQSRAAIFLSEHETQGIAYQQALACGVPILAWDRGGFWQDPEFYPHRVKFEPVSSVPYWDERCGVKFQGVREFPERFDEFLVKLNSGILQPRDYILENLTLEKCAREYVSLAESVAGSK